MLPSSSRRSAWSPNLTVAGTVASPYDLVVVSLACVDIELDKDGGSETDHEWIGTAHQGFGRFIQAGHS